MSRRGAFARQLRKVPTGAEEIPWQILRAGLRNAKFRGPVPIGPHVADFLSHSARVVIEGDGSIQEPARDARRHARLAADDRRARRFGNRTVLTDLLKAKSSISFAIDGSQMRDTA